MDEKVQKKINKINELNEWYSRLYSFFFYRWNEDDYFFIEDKHGNKVTVDKEFEEIIKNYLLGKKKKIEEELNSLLGCAE